MDFAKRAVDHLHYDIDPIIRNRLDNDFYKLLMRKMILNRHPKAQVRFALKNRTSDIPLARIIPIEALSHRTSTGSAATRSTARTGCSIGTS